MLLVRVKRDVLTKARNSIARIKKRDCSASALSKNEETEPRYPPIIDNSPQARFRRNREHEAKGIEDARTVEEKMIKLNMPRYYGWRSLILREPLIPYNAVDQMQYLTRTHVPEEPGLPSYYNDVITPEKLKEKVEKIKSTLEDRLVFECSSRKRLEELDKEVLEQQDAVDDISSQAISKQVHRSLMATLAEEYPHLFQSEIDYDPRIEAFWFAGGIPPPTCVKLWRRKVIRKREKAINNVPDDYENYPQDKAIQYIGNPNFQLRHNLPLPEIIPLSESENPDFTIPVFKYDPRTLGYKYERRHGTNIPGFWPGDTSEFGLLSYHKCGHLAVRMYDDIPDALRVQAVLGSWGWLLAQACNLGFSTFNEINYPLTNQMIITDGTWWSFCVYQLNTLIVHSHYNDENPRRNICWMTKPMKLFDKIENDRVYGLDDRVIENLVKFYVNAPRERVGVEMKPFLQDGEGLVANILGNTKRIWLEERFKLLQSNRPRHRPLPEVYNWQDIYVRKTRTRPMDKKRAPWEFGINMWLRRLDDHCPRYIPRCVRGSKHNPKWEKTYYPK